MTPFVRNTTTIARREYTTRARNRTFVVLSLVVALLGTAFVLLPIGLRYISGQANTTVALFSTATGLPSDAAGAIQASLDATVADAGGGHFTVRATTDPDAARADLTSGALDGLLTITRDGAGDLAFTYDSKAGPTSVQTALVHSAANDFSVGDRLARAGIDPARQAGIFATTSFAVHRIDGAASAVSDADASARSLIGFALVILIFMAIITYGYWIATSVAEEKGTRVMELLIAAATPNQLLVGKVIGAGAAALTQYAMLVAGAAVGLALERPVTHALLGSVASQPPISVDPPILFAFGVYFLLGFLLYAGLYAAAGSLVGKQDVSQVGTPITMLAMVGYMGATFVGGSDATWVTVGSLVPLTSPFFMLTRLAQGAVPPVRGRPVGRPPGRRGRGHVLDRGPDLPGRSADVRPEGQPRIARTRGAFACDRRRERCRMADLIYVTLSVVLGVVLAATAMRGARAPGRVRGFAWIALGLLVTLVAGVGLNAAKDLTGDLVFQRLHFAIFYVGFAVLLWGVRGAGNLGDRPDVLWVGLLVYALSVGIAAYGLTDPSTFRSVAASGEVRYIQEPTFYLPLITALGIALTAGVAGVRRHGGDRRVDISLAAFALLSLIGVLREAAILPGLGNPELDIVSIFLPIAGATICLFVGQSLVLTGR